MRYIHISKPLVTIKAQDGTIKTIVTPARGNTINVGSNKRKAALFIAKKAAKAARRAAKTSKSITDRPSTDELPQHAQDLLRRLVA